VIKILISFLIFRGSFRDAKFLPPMLSLFLRKIFFSSTKKQYFGGQHFEIIC
jgi:hypothetical protein